MKKNIKTKKITTVRKTKGKNITKVATDNTKAKSIKDAKTANLNDKMVLVAMTVNEVNKTTKAIIKSSENIQRRITMLSLKKGWEVLGYSSFKEYVEEELADISLGYDALNRLRRIGLCVFTVAGKEYVGRYKGDAIMRLAKLDTQQQKKVWKELIRQSGEQQVPPEWLNIKRVERALEQLGYGYKDEAIVEPVKASKVAKDKPLNNEKVINVASHDKTVEVTAQSRQADGDEIEPSKNKTEIRFYKSLKEIYADEPAFSCRLMKSIDDSINKKNILILCKRLLIKQEKDDVRKVVKYLKAHFH